MPKRNYVQEILEIQVRMGKKSPFMESFLRLRAVRSLIDEYESPPDEALRYCPVGLVACVEAYFRAVVKDLIDAGEPFSKRAANLERLNFDYQIVAAIHDRAITLGELIAHLIPLNNKQDINSCMSILLDSDFFKQIKEARHHWPWKPASTISPEPVISDPSNVFKDLDKVFELRHIVCHEFAYPIQISINEADRYIESVETFLDATNFIVMELLFRNVPDTQQERNIYFGKKYQEAEEEMRAVFSDVEGEFKGERLQEFKKIQAAWETYRDQYAEFVSSGYEGGSIRPQIHYQRLEYLTRCRITEIKELAESEKL